MRNLVITIDYINFGISLFLIGVSIHRRNILAMFGFIMAAISLGRIIFGYAPLLEKCLGLIKPTTFM